MPETARERQVRRVLDAERIRDEYEAQGWKTGPITGSVHAALDAVMYDIPRVRTVLPDALALSPAAGARLRSEVTSAAQRAEYLGRTTVSPNPVAAYQGIPVQVIDELPDDVVFARVPKERPVLYYSEAARVSVDGEDLEATTFEIKRNRPPLAGASFDSIIVDEIAPAPEFKFNRFTEPTAMNDMFDKYSVFSRYTWDANFSVITGLSS